MVVSRWLAGAGGAAARWASDVSTFSFRIIRVMVGVSTFLFRFTFMHERAHHLTQSSVSRVSTASGGGVAAVLLVSYIYASFVLPVHDVFMKESAFVLSCHERRKKGLLFSFSGVRYAQNDRRNRC